MAQRRLPLGLAEQTQLRDALPPGAPAEPRRWPDAAHSAQQVAEQPSPEDALLPDRLAASQQWPAAAAAAQSRLEAPAEAAAQ